MQKLVKAILMQKLVNLHFIPRTCNNFFVNPFSSDVISPILHHVLNLHEEAKLTNRTKSANELEYLHVNWFSSWVVHSYIICPFNSCFTDSPDNAGHNHVKQVNNVNNELNIATR